MKEEIYKICTKLNDGQIAVVEAQEQLLLLFSVSGRSEQLCSCSIKICRKEFPRTYTSYYPDGRKETKDYYKFILKKKYYGEEDLYN